jgi:hypothetical protein
MLALAMSIKKSKRLRETLLRLKAALAMQTQRLALRKKRRSLASYQLKKLPVLLRLLCWGPQFRACLALLEKARQVQVRVLRAVLVRERQELVLPEPQD